MELNLTDLDKKYLLLIDLSRISYNNRNIMEEFLENPVVKELLYQKVCSNSKAKPIQ